MSSFSARPGCDLLEVRFNARAFGAVATWLKDVCPEITLEATAKQEFKGTAMLPGNIGAVEFTSCHSDVIRWIKSPSDSHGFFFALNLTEVVKASPGGRANELVLSTRKNSNSAQFRYYDPRGSLFLTNNVRWMDYGEPTGLKMQPVISLSATFSMADLIAASTTFTRVGKDNIVFDLETKPDPKDKEKEIYDTSTILLRSNDKQMTFRFFVKKDARTQTQAGLGQPKKKKRAPGWDDSDTDDTDSDEEEECMPSLSVKRGKKGAADKEINQMTNVTMDIEILSAGLKKRAFSFRSKFFHDLLRIPAGIQQVQLQLLQLSGEAFCLRFHHEIPGFGIVESYLMSVYDDADM